MRVKDLVTLYDYTCWARDQILVSIGQLAPEQLVAPSALSYGSMLGTLTHILNAEYLWRVRCQQRVSPTSVRFERPIENLQALQQIWQAEEMLMRDYLHRLEDRDLDEPIAYVGLRGQACEDLLWQIILHMVIHGESHRSELSAKLSELGQSPGNLDFIIYLRPKV